MKNKTAENAQQMNETTKIQPNIDEKSETILTLTLFQLKSETHTKYHAFRLLFYVNNIYIGAVKSKYTSYFAYLVVRAQTWPNSNVQFIYTGMT